MSALSALLISFAITVTNPMGTDRTVPEMVEVGMPQGDGAKQYVVTDEKGDTLSSQVTYDGKLIFPCPTLKAKAKAKFFVREGGADKAYTNEVFGRYFPERDGDFSFENDRVAYRLYGPGSNGVYGYDIFSKRTSNLYLEKLYKLQCDNEVHSMRAKLTKLGRRDLADKMYNEVFSYHVDHGEGMDQYDVGKTLGGGAVAYKGADGKLEFQGSFKTAEVLDNGPLRLTVRLTYANEVRTLSIDAYSNMVKSVVEAQRPFVAGIVMHNSDNKNAQGDGYIAYEDKDGILIACVAPEGKTEREQGHLLIAPISSIYYFGSAWARYDGDGITDFGKWQNYLEAYIQQIKNPLKTKIKKEN